MWCVRLDRAGRFKYAKPRRTDGMIPGAPRLIVWSLAEWWKIDREACEQYLAPDDGARALQVEFCRVTGLDSSGEIRAAMIDAVNRH